MRVVDLYCRNGWNVLYWGRILGYFNHEDVVDYTYAVCGNEPVVVGALLDLLDVRISFVDEIDLIKVFIDSVKCSLLDFVDYFVNCIMYSSDMSVGNVYYYTDILITDIVRLSTSAYFNMDDYDVLKSICEIVYPLGGYTADFDSFENEIDRVLDSVADELAIHCSCKK